MSSTSVCIALFQVQAISIPYNVYKYLYRLKGNGMAKRGPRRNKYTQFGNFLFNLEFFRRHQVVLPDGCHEWTAGRHRQGYGMMGGYYVDTDTRFMTVVHRVAMMVKLGRALASSENVSHTCLNPACVNPEHLVVGDDKLRSQLHKQKGLYKPKEKTGRYSRDKVKQNRKYKYSIEELLFIRNSTSAEIAERFGIDKSRASSMRYGMRRAYGWLKEYEDKNAQDK